MNRRNVLGLFQGFGVELEYMIVSQDSLAVLPVADKLLHSVAGRMANEVNRGPLRWSNELVLHVVELKTNGPAASLEGLDEIFSSQVGEVNRLLGMEGGMLMPGAMHPWMDPDRETCLWPHGDRSIYATYDRVFGCRGHGWSNLQSTHLNLPFADDGEFARLHAAIRLILPLLPAIAAASPVMDGRVNGHLDNRLEVYRLNQRRIPSIIGKIIPEAIFSEEAYRRDILEVMYRDIAPHDPEKILQEEWLNSRGAIARFERNTIEIRLLDIQECPAADLAIIRLIVATLKELADETWAAAGDQQAWHENFLFGLFLDVLQAGADAVIANPPFLTMFGIKQKEITAGGLWRALAQRLLPAHDPAWKPLEVIFDRGPLARRIVNALGSDSGRDQIAAVYRELCRCLREGVMFHG